MINDYFIETLKKRGIRITSSRKQLVSLIAKASHPLSASEIEKLLTSIDRSTIYRELAFLRDEGFIVETKLSDSKARYELKEDECHHHLICEVCGNIDHISLSEMELLKGISQKHNFQIKRHTIEFFGVCSQCSNL